MPKILYFITQSEFGGAQRYVFDLAINLKSDFEIAVALGEQGKNGKLAEKLAKQNIKVFVLPNLKRSINPLNDFLALLQIIKLIKNYRPGVIHLNSSKISILGSLAAFFIKLRSASYDLRVIYTAHGWAFNEPIPCCLKIFYRCAERLASKFKTKIICVSEFDRLTALKYKIAPAEKLVTVHNGISAIDFCSKEKARERLSQLSTFNFQLSTFLVGSIGNLYKTKGYEYLIKAAGILINGQKIPASFIVIGEGEERKNLEDLVKKYNLQNHFILAGEIDEAARLLPAFDVYACSSAKEGLPYTLIEAMQAGLPIVATAVGGNSELIENSVTGLIAESQNSEALAEKIKKMLTDKTLSIALSAYAKTKASAEFGLEKMIAKTKRIYLN